MEPKLGDTNRVAAGTVPKTINAIQDAPTILVEGVNGVAITSHLTKIHFTEHLVVEGELLSRFVVSLAIPTDQFAAIVSLLNSVVEQNIPPQQEGAQ